jgi:hypothetical protein
MYSEAHRPTYMNEVIGHTDAKEKLHAYLSSKSLKNQFCLQDLLELEKQHLH